MASAEQSGEALRDYSSPATWGDVEQVRHSLGDQIADVKTQMAEMESRLETKIADVRTQVAGVETQLETKIAGVQTQVAGVKTEMAGLRTEMVKMESRLELKNAETRAEVVALGTQVAQVEMRLTRTFLGAVAAGVAVLGVLFGIFQAVA